MGKIKHGVGLSRRGFLQSAGAVTAAAILTGCSKGDGETIYLGSSSNGGGNVDIVIPADEKIFSGTAGNNCGGKCLIRAHVSGGAIRRFTTDETPEGTGDEVIKPQKRACLKCRGKVSELYRSDRLLYPLKQTGTRGDVSTFQRISWEQAYKEIADKLKASLEKTYTGTDPYYSQPANSSRYGKGTMFAPFGGGPTHALAGYNFAMRLQKFVAGSIPTNGTAMSYPAVNYIDTFTNNSTCITMTHPTYGFMKALDAMIITEPNYRTDVFNAEQVVLWGFNPADSIMDTSTMYLLIQAKEKGIPFTVIDPNVTRTSRVLGAKHLAPVGGTDVALVCAILYHLLDLQLKDDAANGGVHTKKYLDFDFIKKATHGFFDLPTPTAADFYAGAVKLNPTKYAVPSGASFSAYIMGNDNRLVTLGLNSGISIYPETIGYNVNSATTSPDGNADPLYGKHVPIYGQVVKTPAWASAITGVPEQDIKDLAEKLAWGGAKGGAKVTLYTGWGSNRTVEGEQPVWAINSLAAVLGFWGEGGKSWGSTHMTMTKSAEMAGLQGFNSSAINPAITAVAKPIEDEIINYRRSNPKYSFANTPRFNKTQICQWTDMVMNGGTGKSKWNDPQIKYCTPIRSFIMAGGNPVNQTGDNKYSMDVMRAKQGNEYVLNLAVSVDSFMSPSAQFADYILPGAMAFEVDSFTNSRTAFIAVPKAIEPPGEAKDEISIFEGIVRHIKPEYVEEVSKVYNTSTGALISGPQNNSEVLKNAFNIVKSVTNSEMTFEQFKEKGFIEFAKKSDAAINPYFSAYRKFLENTSAPASAAAFPPFTTSGKLEIYSQGLVEDYESKRWYNFDEGHTLANNGTIYTQSCEYTNNHLDIPTDPNYGTFALAQGTSAEVAANTKKARFVYPIPMYIPLVEGIHADGTEPDPLSLKSEYPYVMTNHHSMWRAHSSNDNNSLANEVYKQDGKGNSAFRKMDSGKGTITIGKGDMPSGVLGVYDPLDINSDDAAALNLKTGDVILVTSPRAAVLLCANVTNTARKGTTRMGEGTWSSFKKCNVTLAGGTVLSNVEIDVAGSANSLASQRPSRICQTSSYGTYQRIKIQKVASVELV